jgi:hypothetical protein
VGEDAVVAIRLGKPVSTQGNNILQIVDPVLAEESRRACSPQQSILHLPTVFPQILNSRADKYFLDFILNDFALG